MLHEYDLGYHVLKEIKNRMKALHMGSLDLYLAQSQFNYCIQKKEDERILRDTSGEMVVFSSLEDVNKERDIVGGSIVTEERAIEIESVYDKSAIKIGDFEVKVIYDGSLEIRGTEISKEFCIIPVAGNVARIVYRGSRFGK